jgi:hypothetical protein
VTANRVDDQLFVTECNYVGQRKYIGGQLLVKDQVVSFMHNAQLVVGCQVVGLTGVEVNQERKRAI